MRHRAVVTELGRARLTSCVPLDWVIKESSPGPGVSLDLAPDGSIIGGTIIGKLGMEDQVAAFVRNVPVTDMEETLTKGERVAFARDQVLDIVHCAALAIGERRLLWIWTHRFTDWLRLSFWNWMP